MKFFSSLRKFSVEGKYIESWRLIKMKKLPETDSLRYAKECYGNETIQSIQST